MKIKKYQKQMKNYAILTSLALTCLLFSGCGCTGTKNTATTQYTFSKSIWKSADSGATWQEKNKTTQKLRASDLDVLTLAINPQDPNDILVGLKNGGIIRSKDGGEDWQQTNFISDKVYGLSFAPDNGQIIYASGVYQDRGKVWKSEDSGQNWKEIYTTPADGPLVISLLADKINTNNIFITLSSNEVLKSADGGTSWKNIYQANGPVTKLSIDALNGNLIYMVVMDGGIYRSHDGGVNFEEISKNTSKQVFGTSAFEVLETDPTHGGWVYLAGKNGIITSKDGGETWSKLVALSDPDSYPITALAINPQNSSEIMYGAAQALYKSQDGGANWSTSQFVSDKTIRVIKYDPVDLENIYLGFKK